MVTHTLILDFHDGSSQGEQMQKLHSRVLTVYSYSGSVSIPVNE